ncbi:MAG: hypothetical protein NZM28_02335 [Fimbriimonadales bacterium]|nr:hypothetical protein [Fimbriimonadales bacterium]
MKSLICQGTHEGAPLHELGRDSPLWLPRKKKRFYTNRGFKRHNILDD